MVPTAGQDAAAAISGYVAAGVFWGAFAAATPAFQALSGLDPAGFGLLLLALTSGALPTMLLFGRHADRVERWAMPACLIAFAAAVFVLARAGGLPGLFAGLLLTGAASGALDIALNMRVSAIERTHGIRLFNRAHAAFPLAMLATSLGVGVAREAGVATGLVFSGVALALLAAAAAEAALASRRPAPNATPEAEPAQDGASARRPRGRPGLALALLGAVAALGAFQEMAPQAWAAIFVETGLGASAVAGGAAPAAFTLGLSLGRLIAHEAEARLAPLRIVRIAALAGVPAFALVAAAPGWPVALAGLLLAGMAVGPVEPTVFRTVTERAAEGARGTTLSVVTTIAYLGYLASPPVLGAVAQALGWPALWLTAATLSALVAGLATVLRLRIRAEA
jgi:predicted MFS family arabinose efflux permease